MKKILIINGPNINLLHKRNKEIYGDCSLEKIMQICKEESSKLKLKTHFFQSNSEGEIVNEIQNACDKFDGIIINAAAYTHTSVAIRDALEIFNKPKIEIHISNIFKRESFRHNSLISDVVDSVICGLGIEGYKISLISINHLCNQI